MVPQENKTEHKTNSRDKSNEQQVRKSKRNAGRAEKLIFLTAQNMEFSSEDFFSKYDQI